MLKHCEQFHAISALRMAFPKNVKIYIKEHPYTYKQPIDPRFRPISKPIGGSKSRIANYYELFSSLEGVEFIDPMYPSYDLIDQASFISTITGKTGFQALLRNKPVIAFGTAAYREHPACHEFTTASCSTEKAPKRSIVACIEKNLAL